MGKYIYKTECSELEHLTWRSVGTQKTITKLGNLRRLLGKGGTKIVFQHKYELDK